MSDDSDDPNDNVVDLKLIINRLKTAEDEKSKDALQQLIEIFKECYSQIFEDHQRNRDLYASVKVATYNLKAGALFSQLAFEQSQIDVKFTKAILSLLDAENQAKMRDQMTDLLLSTAQDRTKSQLRYSNQLAGISVEDIWFSEALLFSNCP